MQRFIIGKAKKSGLPPGSLVHIGKKSAEKINITLIDYDKKKYVEKSIEDIEDCFKFKNTRTNSWINIDGIHNAEFIEKLGKNFGLHPLILEDIMSSEQRPKLEEYDDYLYIVLKMLYLNDKKDEIDIEQVSIIIGKNYVLSFQEKQGDVFEGIRKRLRNEKGKIRTLGTDYLAYAMIDAIVDNYFVILETFGELIESLEEEVVTNPTSKTSKKIHSVKREMIALRKSVWPLREVARSLETNESSLIKDSTKLYLRDVYDHTIQVIDNVETFRDIVSGMLDVYLSSVSNKMNEIMKVLTIFATIFIPLTFIVGLYGMNFKYFPELEWKYSYPVLWVIMISISLVMLNFFRKRKWI